ncbi:DNA helicase loader [Paraglaciecola Antarctic GD virus 1]|nr:DNA helicase loader [Paraglaciecola Antarctic GD virus 1]
MGKSGGFMSGFSLFKMHVAIKAHFEGKYSIPKYGVFAENIKYESYIAKTNYKLYERLSTRYNSRALSVIIFYSVLNEGIKNVADISGQVHKDSLEYLRKFIMIGDRFKEDMENIFELIKTKGNSSFNSIFSFTGGHPPIFKMLLTKSIELETFMILDSSLNLIDMFDKYMRNDFTWDVERVRLIAYKELLIFDKPLINCEINRILKTNCNKLQIT